MFFYSVPQYVQSTLRRLENHGFEAYLVGGCVRDLLLGKRPHDWDICTSARPENTMEIFPKNRPTGIKHGTVTVRVHGRDLEVTSFRSDGQYLDNRHPSSVSFVSDINQDLLRRDFTMNAIACPLEGELCDPFHGQEDIKRKLIRCVGDPYKRFSEDSLRMLRALRFSAVLGFEIEDETNKAIIDCSSLSSSLAAERISTELEKTLLSPNPQKAADMVSLGLLSAIPSLSPVNSDFSSLALLPKKSLLRFAGMCAILLRDGAIKDPALFLKELRRPALYIKAISRGIDISFSHPHKDYTQWKRILSHSGLETSACAAAVSDIFYGKGHLDALKIALNSGECFSIKELAINGDDLKNAGYKGTEIGNTLNILLNHVIDNPEDNKKEILLKLLK